MLRISLPVPHRLRYIQDVADRLSVDIDPVVPRVNPDLERLTTANADADVATNGLFTRDCISVRWSAAGIRAERRHPAPIPTHDRCDFGITDRPEELSPISCLNRVGGHTFAVESERDLSLRPGEQSEPNPGLRPLDTPDSPHVRPPGQRFVDIGTLLPLNQSGAWVAPR